MTDGVLAQLAELSTMEIRALKSMWRDLNGFEPPPYNRKFLESRLAYRIQELAYGGLKPATLARLAELTDELLLRGKRRRVPNLPVVGTKLLREWQRVEHTVTVTAGGFEYSGRPYKSLSAVARSITGTRWNGWVFFGLRKQAVARHG